MFPMGRHWCLFILLLLTGGFVDNVSVGAQAISPTVVTVYAEQQVRPVDRRFFGVNLMFWDENDSAMADGRITTYLTQMPCRMLRFPGGTESEGYIWKSNRLRDKTCWPFKDGPDCMDTDRFIALCRKIKTEPVICVNTEIALYQGVDASARLAAEWVRYCNIEKKYRVTYWEIGNEPYYRPWVNGEEYGKLFRAYAGAMKAVDPSIKLAAVGEWNIAFEGAKEKIPADKLNEAQHLQYQRDQGQWSKETQIYALQTRKGGKPWWPAVLDTAGSNMDAASFHWYFSPDDLRGMTVNIEKLRLLIHEKVPGKQIPLICTEWNVNEWIQTYGLERALSMGEGACRMLDAGVMMAALWPLRYEGMHAKKSLLDPTAKTPTANYAVLSLLSQEVGDQRIAASVAGDQTIYTFASHFSDDDATSIILINRSSTPVDRMDLRIIGMSPRHVSARLLSAVDPASNSTTLKEIRIQSASNDDWQLELPAKSLIVVRLTEK